MVVRTRQFTRADYYRLAQAGVLGEDDRVELLEGVIASMSPIGPLHSSVVRVLIQFFTRELGQRVLVDAQNPVILDESSEPQPDLTLLKPRADAYRHAHPAPQDVLLLVEVAEASIELDLGEKAHLYAQAGVPEYWVADLVHKRIIVHRRPAGDRYQDITDHRPGAALAPDAFPDIGLPVETLFQ
ncbi:MAG: Uma2 family endonuclease [Planctomycetota bacterium]